MSGFQIPGLGQAKPNETLPPLPADVLAAAASAHGNEELPDAPEQNGDAQQPTEEKANTEQATAAQIEAPVLEDAMVVDQPASPPSLTSALEASIGGLGQQPPQEPEMLEPAALQNDASANPEWEIDSSPYQSSDSSSSDSSSDEDDSDNEGYELLGVEETARLLMAEGGSDDEGERGGKTGNAAQLRTKNELAEEAIPKPEVTITPEMKLEELGVIEHIVDTIALIKAFTPGEYQVLDSGSVICTAERVVIGAISETIGKVLQPMYTVIFSSEEEVKELGLEVGSKVYYTPEHATFIFTEPLKNIKGSDASNLYDEEAGDDDVEFSDDEKEAEHKRAVKQKKKDKWKNANGKGGSSSNDHPLRQEMNVDGGLNYDDDDGPYKPLARPSSMASGPSTETYEPQPRGGFRGGRRGDSRGRGRGFARGRGGRSSDGYSMPPQSQNQYQQPSSNAAAPPPPPSAANFGFQVPGWPQGGAAAPPPPPPGWQPGQQANPQMVNPAMLAAFMNHIQSQQGGTNQQGGWGAHPPPPPSQ